MSTNRAVSTITLTSLRRSIDDSCQALDRQILNGHTIEHIVAVDSKTAPIGAILDIPQTTHSHRVVLPLSERLPKQRVVRLATLRNLAIDASTGAYISFLDDDNSYYPDHVRRLIDVIEAGSDAAHSWAEWVTSDGRPYLEHFVPFHSSKAEGMHAYRKRVAWGTLRPGDNVSRDIARSPDGGPGTVDMGEWMIRAEILRQIRFREVHTAQEELESVTEDDKLLIDLLAAKVEIGCSFSATHVYRMGGFTNAQWSTGRRSS